MNAQKQMKANIAANATKTQRHATTHQMILASMPACKLWFLNGKDEKGKIVSNPNIGYGSQTMKYANGKTREIYQWV